MSRKRRQERPPGVTPARPAARASRSPLVVVALALLVAALGYLAYTWLGSAATTEIPDPISADMQAPVVRVLRAAREGVVREPRSAAAWGKYGATLDAHHLYDAAAVAYRRAHELAPRDFSWIYLLAVVQDFRGQAADEVVELFQKALDLNGAYPPGVLRFGDALVRQGRGPEAREAYQESLRLDPDFAMAHRGLGQVLLTLGDAAGGVPHLERAMAQMPDDQIAASSLARGYQLLGDPRAGELASRASQLQPQLGVPDPIRYDVELLAVSPVACIRRFQAAMQARAWPTAIPDLKLLIEMFPDEALYHLNLGICQQEGGDQEAALTSLARAVELDTDRTDARVRLGATLMALGRPAEAVAHYRRASELEPQTVGHRVKLGLALGVSGDLPAAITELRNATELAPDDPEARHNLGTALMRRGDHADAARELREALRLNPGSTGTLYNLGIVLEQLGKKEEAIRYFRRGAELEPQGLAARRLAELQQGTPN